MKIALDATPLSVPAGGIRRYTEELTRALAEEAPEDRFWLLSDQPFRAVAGVDCGRPPSSPLERRWWTIGLPRELARIGADVFHGTDFAVPWRRSVPSVITVHDLSPWRLDTREETTPRVRRRGGALLRLRRATMTIVPTRAIRTELIERFALEPETVVAVPLAASGAFRPVAAPPSSRPYFLHVGARRRRKNIEVIDHANVVMAGGRQTDEQLAALYSGAVACLVPSLYEGFGLPVLEAMQCGCPVIVSRDPALMEVSGGAAEHVDATDARRWHAAMEALLAKPELREDLRARGFARASEFSWRRTARLTREVYAEALRRFRR